MGVNNNNGDEIEYVDDIDNSFSSRVDTVGGPTQLAGGQEEAGRSENQSKKPLPRVALKATKKINRMRVLLSGLIVLSTALASGTVYFVSRGQESDTFKQAFRSRSVIIMEAVQSHLERQLISLDTLSASIAAQVTAC
jgi:hypothetical protein